MYKNIVEILYKFVTIKLISLKILFGDYLYIKVKEQKNQQMLAQREKL